jgi:sRNA-binding regulator protein Hfq
MKIPTTFFLILCLLLTFTPLARGQQSPNEAETTKVKAEAKRRLDKNENRVKIKLRNGSELKGRITQTAENSFTITDEKTGARSDISYTDVQKLSGRGWSKTAKIAIGVGAAVATFAALFAYAFTHIWDD